MREKDEKDIAQLQNRLRELSEKSFRQGIFLFTDFLGLDQQEIFHRMEGEFQTSGFTIYGGREQADRVMVRFGDSGQLGYEVEFPIVCIHIQPVHQKFADDLSHRDFLGALMNLGIERSTMGDIIVGEKEAFLFCVDKMADFICEQLHQVKHTFVKCRVTGECSELPVEEPEHRVVQVASARADAVLARVYNLSRDDSLELFRGGRVYISGRLCENNSKALKAGDVVNARGFGKFLYIGERGETRKGKTNVEVAVYR